ncbi:MAG: ABC transporter permease [Candidatus Kapabacteria bacterium]|nr:ABC transporter permease [Candidatus Kapabacteria bacterium]MDW8012849.1 ABC transporter permease [Bacteroidota bacterium]
MSRWVELSEALAVAIDAIRANAFRSLLTTLGIAVGSLFVSLMGWFLYGLDTTLERTIALLGPDMLYVDKWDWSGQTRWEEVRSRKDITYRQAQELIVSLTGAEVAVPLVDAFGITVSAGGRAVKDLIVVGTLSTYGQTPLGTIQLGRFLSAAEDRYGVPVVVLGYLAARELFPRENAIGKTVRIAGYPFTVVGILEQQGTTFAEFIDKQIFIPLPTFQRVLGFAKRSFTIAVKAGSEERMEQVRAELRALMRRIRGLPPGAPDDFSINEIQVFRDQIAGLRRAVWGVGIGMSMLSFIVGIIGIVNIMFVSVVERTREIGIRKAVGARHSSIALQFLLEATLLCVAGAAIALVVGNGIAALIVLAVPQAKFLTPYIPPQHIGLALLIAFSAGIIAGWAPTLRAARLDPVQALRYE